ncbi:glycosyl hydrolase family 31 [Serinibacter salmoneus]|uniref:Glycosyl hydrolase family 31 n=2 Tax=Serinibacter salmoneus TaxID=556530 RepID=A0A2A9CX50_9MICO|nr:glycosyl hydrolase family 31 [Serinibacter salmoneus]
MSDGRPAPARPDAVVTVGQARFTVLTSRLIRMEWHPQATFVDERTQRVVARDFGATPEFTVTREGNGSDAVTIRTEHLLLRYAGGEFSASTLQVTLIKGASDDHYASWSHGTTYPQDLPFRGNLRGTARTLDEVDGATELEPGILATFGFAVLEDSGTVLLTADGWVGARPAVPAGSAPAEDLYLFGHGRDFRGALRDYHLLTGAQPLVPRYVLGNWWSRYKAYHQEEYLELMDTFEGKGIPLSVAVIDMDWHLVDIDPEIGTGWTGYTWNRDLFPDHRAFLAELHRRGLAVTLNVHPADGIRRHEERYPQMARAVGVDPESGDQIPFDVTSREFVDAYLREIHHPLEAEGVDFWWLDWQSGGVTSIPGLDPLWMLNHIHYLDSGRERRAGSGSGAARRPLTFSRYAGIGSHRYPIGFSGDTIITWESLDFQPEFTATAANVGYGWWSHDVGGHMFGGRDVQMAVRWFQLGVFSPINRLHSSVSPFTGKEPWTFGPRAESAMTDILRLRHALVPALYTAAWAAHREGVSVIRPMYHDHPRTPGAFSVPNQAMVGEHLLLAPITTPEHPTAHIASVTAWLPPGDWVDVFTGHRHRGGAQGRHVVLHRGLEGYPVLARAGSVLPLQPDVMAPVAERPETLVLRAVPGTATSRLVEDDGGAAPSRLVEDDGGAAPSPEVTVFSQTFTTRDGVGDLVLSCAPGQGEGELPSAGGRRRILLDVVGAVSLDGARVHAGGQVRQIAVVPSADQEDEVARQLAPALRLDLGEIDLAAGFEVRLSGLRARERDAVGEAFDVLHHAEIAFTAKEEAWAAVRERTGLEVVQELARVDVPEVLRGALVERVAALPAW